MAESVLLSASLAFQSHKVVLDVLEGLSLRGNVLVRGHLVGLHDALVAAQLLLPLSLRTFLLCFPVLNHYHEKQEAHHSDISARDLLGWFLLQPTARRTKVVGMHCATVTALKVSLITPEGGTRRKHKAGHPGPVSLFSFFVHSLQTSHKVSHPTP